MGGFIPGSCTHSYGKALKGQALLAHTQFKVLIQESWTAALGLYSWISSQKMRSKGKKLDKKKKKKYSLAFFLVLAEAQKDI